MKKEISIIIPFYNEKENVKDILEEVFKICSELRDYNFELICINDGSNDGTLEKLIDFKDNKKIDKLTIIDFSRNFGKEAAISAGIDYAKGDAIIILDADFQDPPYLILDLIKEWEKGNLSVLAKRIDRSKDSWFKRNTAIMFYKIFNILCDIKIPENVGDCRIIDKKVAEIIRKMPERRRFMKGMLVWPGFNYSIVEYHREIRHKGKSSFNFIKLSDLALEGIVNFTYRPLRLWFYFGFILFFISILYASFIFLRTIIKGVDVPGYASLIIIALFFGSIQVLGIGILGEYIGRIYMEVKKRPLYVVNRIY